MQEVDIVISGGADDIQVIFGRVGRVGRQADVPQEGPTEVADQPAVVGPEGQAVTADHPLHADEAQHDHALHEDGQDVLSSNQAAVEERQPRRHQHAKLEDL